MPQEAPRILVGVTGASGAAVTLSVLDQLRRAGAEIHLVVSRWGEVTLRHECGLRTRDLADRVERIHANSDMAAPVASGSFPVDATLIVPCSARTLGAIATGTADTLIARAADVALKERRRLVLALREAPLSTIHLRNAAEASAAGAIIHPLTPAFYTLPQTLDEVVEHLAGRLVDLCGVPTDMPRWGQSVSLRRDDEER